MHGAARDVRLCASTALIGAGLIFIGANVVILGFDHFKIICAVVCNRLDDRRRRQNSVEGPVALGIGA